MWLSSAFSRYPIHPNRHSSFLFVILPFSLWAEPADFCVLYFQLKAGCWILSLATLLAKGHLGHCGGACAWHREPTGQSTAAQCLKQQEHGFWWHMSGPVLCSNKGQWGTAGAPRELGSLCVSKACEKCKFSEARVSDPTQGMFLERHISEMAMLNCCYSTEVAEGSSSERLQRSLLIFTVGKAACILF